MIRSLFTGSEGDAGAFALDGLRLRLSWPDALPLALPGVEGFEAGFRCRIVGVGKFCFLSMASTVRWNRRNRA